MKIFQFSYNPNVSNLDEETVTAFISENKNISEWSAPFPGCMILKSESRLRDLKDSVARLLRRNSFIISEVGIAGMAGQLPNEIWNWVNTGLMPDEDIAKLSKMRLEKAAARSRVAEGQ